MVLGTLPTAPLQGTLLRVDLVATADLPHISTRSGVGWSGNQALAFGAAVLGWMRAQAAAQPGAHLRFSYDGGSGGGSGSGSGAAGVIRCSVVGGGALPGRVQRCLRECGLAA